MTLNKVRDDDDDDESLTQISRPRYYSTPNHSKMVQDTAIVTTADQYKVVHDLSIGAICDNLERPMAQI